MRNTLIAVVLIAILIVGIPLFYNYQSFGNVLGRESGVITAVADYWLSLMTSFTEGFNSSSPSTGGRFE